MSPIDLIKNLSLNLSWRKKVGANASSSKIKTKNNNGDIAGRDMHKITYIQQSTSSAQLPYVYVEGSFGGNGHILKFRPVIYNLGNQFILIEKMSVLDHTISFNNQPIKAGESLRHIGLDDLAYPISNDIAQDIKIFFHTQDQQSFMSIQKLQFQQRADGRYDIKAIEEPVVTLREVE